jgi:hypothetical protein
MIGKAGLASEPMTEYHRYTCRTYTNCRNRVEQQKSVSSS